MSPWVNLGARGFLGCRRHPVRNDRRCVLWCCRSPICFCKSAFSGSPYWPPGTNLQYKLDAYKLVPCDCENLSPSLVGPMTLSPGLFGLGPNPLVTGAGDLSTSERCGMCKCGVLISQIQRMLSRLLCTDPLQRHRLSNLLKVSFMPVCSYRVIRMHACRLVSSTLISTTPKRSRSPRCANHSHSGQTSCD